MCGFGLRQVRQYNRPVDKKILYSIKRSTRARTMRLMVAPGGTVHVTAPERMESSKIDAFVHKHGLWIEKAVSRMRLCKALPVSGRRDYLKHKERAREFIVERVEYWNEQLGFRYGRISIKNTKRLWGSCSRKGNLNFSYTLLFLPLELADYVVLHELCHLKEHNHGATFWNLVALYQPQYLQHRKELARYIRS